MQGQAEKKVITGTLVKQAKKQHGESSMEHKTMWREVCGTPRTKTRDNWSPFSGIQPKLRRTFAFSAQTDAWNPPPPKPGDELSLLNASKL